MIDLILAAPDLRDEPALVSSAPGNGVHLLRRCVDAVDLLAAAAVDASVAVVVSAGLPRLSADVVSRLGPSRRLVGLAADPLEASMLDGLGVSTVLAVQDDADTLWRAIRSAVDGAPGVTPVAASGVFPTGLWGESEEPADEGASGVVIPVWGPMGAPGRTTVAVALSEALADAGRRVCLVDADTYAPSIGLALGMVDELGGLLRACRQADNGMLDVVTVMPMTRRIRGDWHVLTGIPRSARWSELTPPALDRVWQSLRTAFDVVVVDVGFCLEDDDSSAAWARRRNAATLSALAASDHALAVASATSAGAARLVAAWPEFSSAVLASSVTVVRNRVERGATPGWTEAVLEVGVTARVHAVPSDAKAVDACWSRGRSLAEGARRSRMRRSISGLARQVVSG